MLRHTQIVQYPTGFNLDVEIMASQKGRGNYTNPQYHIAPEYVNLHTLGLNISKQVQER